MVFIASYLKRAVALALTVIAAQAMVTPTAAEGSECPTAVLPRNIIQLTYFGERPSWSPDGSKIAFMSKSYGDALEIDLMTERITLLASYPHPGYLRVQYLPNGDLFLIGASTYEDMTSTRQTSQEMWVLRPGENEPVALGQKIFEGVAISRKTNRIAWAASFLQYPDLFAPGESAIYMADIIYRNNTPVLANQREVQRGTAPICILEAQDFRNNDSELIYTCYIGEDEDSLLGDVRGINLVTGEVVIYRSVPNEYNEAEGIYPDGRYMLIEIRERFDESC